MIVTKTCRYCKHYGIVFKKNGAIEYIGCRVTKQPLRPDEATEDSVCGSFEEDLRFKEKNDVSTYVCDMKCSGCEYANYDREGMAYPGEEGCLGCQQELNEFWSDYDKLSLQQLIDKYTLGNDKVIAFYWCGNFEGYFRGFKRVKKGDTFAFIKE